MKIKSRFDRKYVQVITLLFVFLCYAEVGTAAVVKYASSLVNVNPAFAAPASSLLGLPDNDFIELHSDVNATYGGFSSGLSVSTSALRTFLGISQAELEDVDFFAFDLNGGGPGFEDSEWIFEDSAVTLPVHMHSLANTPNGIMVGNHGNRSRLLYNSLFGTTLNTAPPADVAVILFNLSDSGIDVSLPSFQVTMTGVGASTDPVACQTQCPDLTQFGIVTDTVIPEPSTLFLATLGLMGIGCRRRQRA